MKIFPVIIRARESSQVNCHLVCIFAQDMQHALRKAVKYSTVGPIGWAFAYQIFPDAIADCALARVGIYPCNYSKRYYRAIDKRYGSIEKMSTSETKFFLQADQWFRSELSPFQENYPSEA